VLKEPLKATNALRLNKQADVLQLVEDLAGVLHKTPESASSYNQKALKVVEVAQSKTVAAPVGTGNP
jgi:hypothetical protein